MLLGKGKAPTLHSLPTGVGQGEGDLSPPSNSLILALSPRPAHSTRSSTSYSSNDSETLPSVLCTLKNYLDDANMTHLRLGSHFMMP